MKDGELLKKVRAGVKPLIEGRGFADRGDAFERRLRDVVQVISFQRGKKVPGFAVNLGIDIPELREVESAEDAPPEIATRLRAPEGGDAWWSVRGREKTPPKQLVAETTAEVAAELGETAWPFFERFPSIETVIEACERGEDVPSLGDARRDLIGAILVARRGRTSGASRTLERLWQEAHRDRHDAFAEHVKRIAATLGLAPRFEPPAAAGFSAAELDELRRRAADDVARGD